MAKVKIVIIGGGSYTWTHTIARDILVKKFLSGSELRLHDIDRKALDENTALVKKMAGKAGTNFKITKTLGLEKALKGADYVIVTISTGGLEAMRVDVEAPMKYGVFQPVGDTVGPGGISRALRSVPVFANIAKRMEELCPDAWLLNYTNPMTMLVRAVTKTSKIKCLGMCHELFGLFMHLSKMLKLGNWRNFEARVFGINHFVWASEIRHRGRDVMRLIRDYIKKHGTKGNMQVKLELFKLYGALPVAGDRHIVEFMPHFCNERTNGGADFGVKLTSMEERYGWLRDARKLVADMISGRKKISMRQSCERVSDIIVALSGGRKEIDIVNLPNRGQIDNLPAESVVETMALIDAFGAHPLTVGEIPRPLQALFNLHIQKQEMTVEAALTGDRNLTLQALLIDPLVRDWKTAPAMLDEMLEGNKKYLPQFFG